jgi:mono/diheme cytochrome c family protein
MKRVAMLLACALAANAAQAQEHSDTIEDLPQGAGREATFFTCTACHGVAIIRAQGMSRERWDGTIDEMIRRHAMPEPDAADRRLIADYLATTFPPRARGRTNPFATRP